MSNASNRRASTPVNPFAPVDKTLLVHLLGKMGLSLTVEKHNKGEWNEFRVFSATDGNMTVELDRPSKGEKPDWAFMLKTAEKTFR